MADRKTAISKASASIGATRELDRAEAVFGLAWQLFGK
ncbi:hypothetical protein X971_3955 [Agrobacterium tumefaciens LBA4213 (Ach5)]|nr:hypothetical protein X971_3955 [Agrobacterium tumefaciens LBA4213 (Ach5)]